MPRLSQALFTVSPEQQELSVAFSLLLTAHCHSGKDQLQKLANLQKIGDGKSHLCYKAVGGCPGDTETDGCPEELALPVTPN